MNPGRVKVAIRCVYSTEENPDREVVETKSAGIEEEGIGFAIRWIFDGSMLAFRRACVEVDNGARPLGGRTYWHIEREQGSYGPIFVRRS